MVFATEGAEADFADELTTGLGLLATHFTIVPLHDVPLNANRKVDYKALKARAEELIAAPSQPDGDLIDLLERLLRASPLDMSRSFVDYGGNSLSYLEVQLHFQRAGKSLPPSSETLPLANLTAHAGAEVPADRARWVPLSGDVIWRIAAITGVIFHHTTPWKLSGGAYLMLVLAGLSLARFQSGNLFAGRGLQVLRTMLLPLLLGYFAILALVHVTGKPVDIEWYLLLGNFDLNINPPGIEPYWFVCAYAQLVAMACLPFMVPNLARSIAQNPFFAGLIGLCLAFAVVEVLNLSNLIPGLRIRHTFGGLELFMIGWCIHFAQSSRAKWIMLMVLIAIFLRHWSGISLSAAIFIYLGVSTTLIRAHIRVPSEVANAALSMASVTMFAYLIHPIVQSVVEPMGLPLWVLALAVSVISFVAATIVKLAIDRLAAIQVRQVA